MMLNKYKQLILLYIITSFKKQQAKPQTFNLLPQKASLFSYIYLQSLLEKYLMQYRVYIKKYLYILIIQEMYKKMIYQVLFLSILVLVQVSTSQYYPKTYLPLDNSISLHGRYYVDKEDVKYDWSCFKIQFCFVNSTKVVWKVVDSWNNYQVSIDQKDQKIIKPRTEQQIIIFESKVPESHCVQIVKITQNHYGPLGSRKDSAFKGIEISNGMLKRSEKDYKYRFQFLGDSLTSAFGDLSGRNPECMLHLRNNQNCLESWAHHLSQIFHADYRVAAISGKGLVKNNFFITGPTMMKKFTEITDNSKENSYFYQDGYYPDVLFFFIGGNDYSNIFPPNKNNFIQAYKQLTLNTLKKLMPLSDKHTKIIHICDAKFNKELCFNIKTAGNEVRYAYKYIYYVQIPDGTLQKEDIGCVGHPNAQGHAKMAKALYEQVRRIIQE